MFFPEGQVRVHLYGRQVDMRCSFDGLYALTRQELEQDPTSGRFFAFINRRAKQTTFNIPIELRCNRIPMASSSRQAVTYASTHRAWQQRVHSRRGSLKPVS